MGSGIAKSIRERWPVVYSEYKAKFDETEEDLIDIYGHLENQIDISEVLLGDIQLVKVDNNKTVINMFGQQFYGHDGRKYTSYDGFWSCLERIKNIVPTGSTIGFPDHIGCGLGGANWEVIYTMIKQVLGNNYKVYIYKLEA